MINNQLGNPFQNILHPFVFQIQMNTMVPLFIIHIIVIFVHQLFKKLLCACNFVFCVTKSDCNKVTFLTAICKLCFAFIWIKKCPKPQIELKCFSGNKYEVAIFISFLSVNFSPKIPSTKFDTLFKNPKIGKWTAMQFA